MMKKKHDKRFLNSATSAIHMDGQEKIITVTVTVTVTGESAKQPNLLFCRTEYREPDLSNQIKIVYIHVDKTWHQSAWF